MEIVNNIYRSSASLNYNYFQDQPARYHSYNYFQDQPACYHSYNYFQDQPACYHSNQHGVTFRYDND